MFVRVVLDTCTVRKHVSNRTPQLDINFIKQKRDKVRPSLSASVAVPCKSRIVAHRQSPGR
jgi:hypothetical protein